MSEQVVEPKIRGFISLTAHPEGCAMNVRQQVELARTGASGELGNALVIGSSTGYGLASFLVTAFGYGASTLGVCFEKEPSDTKTATAGWYNLVEAHRLAEAEGRHVETINGDAFSDEVKREVVRALRDRFGPLDTVVYSLAAPRRRDAEGTIWNSALKPVGESYSGKAFDLRKHEVIEAATIEPASEEEIEATRKVMGGEDWRAWVELLLEEGLIADGCRMVAYSYIGPEVTAALYRRGTIGRAKEDLEATASDLNAMLEAHGGGAWVSINKGVVTQASSAIPGVPLYMSLLFKAMKEREIDEGPIEQIMRLYADYLGPGRTPTLDDEHRIRLDDLEMREDVQREVSERWDLVTTENLYELTDYAGYRRSFEELFGFGVNGVDYTRPTEVNRQLPQFVAP
jgi:enoyl-[acyl-carrier protein] reductase/trans-2-enoyl-CoA reductase (NAD+)